MPRIALLQNQGSADRRLNLDRTIAGIREAAAKGAHIVCTQEMFTTLYFCTRQDPAFHDLAEPMPGPLTCAHCPPRTLGLRRGCAGCDGIARGPVLGEAARGW